MDSPEAKKERPGQQYFVVQSPIELKTKSEALKWVISNGGLKEGQVILKGRKLKPKAVQIYGFE